MGLQDSWFRGNILKQLEGFSDIALVCSLIFVGGLLRLPSLRLGLWRDEGATYFDAIPADLGEVFQTVAHCELNPPGFYVVMHYWMQWFGDGEIIFKGPALILGLLIIPATYGLGRVTCSPRTGLIAATIATCSPTAIYYSQEARPYTFAALLCCLVIVTYLKSLTSPHQNRYLLGGGLCLSLLLYTQYTGLLLMMSLVFMTLYIRWRHIGNIQLSPFVLAFGISSLLFLPWLPTFILHLANSPWADSVPWQLRPLLVFQNLAYPIPLPYQGSAELGNKAMRAATLGLMLWPLGIEIKAFFAPARPCSRDQKQLPPATAVLSVCFVLLAILQASRSDAGRHFFPFITIAWVLYAKWLIIFFKHLNDRWEPWFRRSRLFVISLIILVFVLPNVSYALALGTVDKSGMRQVAADRGEISHVKTMYLVSPCKLGPSFGYYFAQSSVQFYGFPRWHHPELFSPQGYAELWNQPTLIADIEQQIHAQVDQKGYQQLALVQEGRPLADRGQIRYSKANDLLYRLRQQYPLLTQVEYSGIKEPITLFLFSLIPIDQ